MKLADIVKYRDFFLLIQKGVQELGSIELELEDVQDIDSALTKLREMIKNVEQAEN